MSRAEADPATDQFVRLDRGRSRAQVGPSKDELTFDQEVTDGWCVIIPAHEPGKVQPPKAIADTDTADEPADSSVQPDPVADQDA